jgi:hypothetical protein
VMCYLFWMHRLFHPRWQCAFILFKSYQQKEVQTVLCWKKFCPFWNLLFLSVDSSWSVPLCIKGVFSFFWPATASSTIWLWTVLQSFFLEYVYFATICGNVLIY